MDLNKIMPDNLYIFKSITEYVLFIQQVYLNSIEVQFINEKASNFLFELPKGVYLDNYPAKKYFLLYNADIDDIPDDDYDD